MKGTDCVEDLHNAVGLLFFLTAAWLVAPPVVAVRKGYEGTPWFCALGMVGVAVLAFFPVIGPSYAVADRGRLRARANRIGLGLSVVGVLTCITFVLLNSMRDKWHGR